MELDFDKLEKMIESGKVKAVHTHTYHSRTISGKIVRTSSESRDLDGMVIDTNDDNFDFNRFFYESLPQLTGQSSLLVHDFGLKQHEKEGDVQKFTVDVAYTPLRNRYSSHGVFELMDERKSEQHNLLVKSLQTVKGVTYSVKRVQPEK
jgi:hypothetical protein